MSTASDSPEITAIDPAVSPTPPPPQTEPLRSELSRQVSIYSLTLDEIQNTLCDLGKNFGSMNMDEFICNIWTAEEASQATAAAAGMSNSVTADSFPPVPLQPQPSLPRQGSLTLPPPLCRKTVEEVWADIHHVQPQELANMNGSSGGGGNQRQPTLGEMTLEDFLIKAGIVRQGCPTPQPYINDAGGATALNVADFGHGNIALHYPDTVGVVAGTQEVGGRNHVQLAGVTPGYPIRTGRPRPVINGCLENPIAVAPPAIAVPAAGGYVNGGYAQMACGSPASPLSLDGMCNGHVENSGLYGMEMKGKKRTLDGGPVEKVVERRQRRMIKNRESAARSRARKQAYTVELEAELKLLREENSNLLNEQKEEKEMKQQQWLDMLNYLMQHPPTQPRYFLSEKGLKKVRSW